MSDSAAIKRVVFAESIRFTRFILCAQIVCHITGKPSVVIPAQVHFFQSLCVAGFPVSPPVIHVSPTEPELFAPERVSQVDEMADSRRCFKQGPSGGCVLWDSVLAQITRDDVKKWRAAADGFMVFRASQCPFWRGAIMDFVSKARGFIVITKECFCNSLIL